MFEPLPDLPPDALTKLFKDGLEITVTGTFDDADVLCGCEGCVALDCRCLRITCCVKHRMAARDHYRRWARAHQN